MRDLYPPLAAAGERSGGLVPNTAGSHAAVEDDAPPPVDVNRLTDEVRQSSAFLDDVFTQVARVVVGQREMVERVLIGLLTGEIGRAHV